MVTSVPSILDQTPLGVTVPAAAWRHRWVVLLGGLLGGVLGVAYSYLSPPRITAEIQIEVEDPSAATVFGSSLSNDAERYTATQAQIIESRSVEQQASQLMVAKGYTLTAEEIDGAITVDAGRNSSLITITAARSDADSAIAAAEAVVGAYKEMKAESARRASEPQLGELDRSLNAIDTRIAELQTSIVAATGRGPLDSQFAANVTEIGQLQVELATAAPARAVDIRARVADLSTAIQIYQQIQQAELGNPLVESLREELTAANQRRATLEARRSEIEVDTTLRAGGIVFETLTERSPGNGRAPVRLGLVGGLLGGLLGLGLAYWLADRHLSFTDRSEPEMLVGSAALAEIPDFAYEGIKDMLAVENSPRTQAAEAFRFAAAGLDIKARGGIKSIIAVSASVGDGKTVVVANTAMAAAREGNRVLVIDADFGNQALTQLLTHGGQPPQGLTELVETGLELRRAAASVQGSNGATLTLLSRGHRPVTPANFFRSAATRVFFEAVREEFDLILIDAPPLLQVAYTSSIARYCDAALLVVNHGSRVQHLSEVMQRLEFIGTQAIGYVYNRAPLKEMVLEGSLADVIERKSSLADSAKKKTRLR